MLIDTLIMYLKGICFISITCCILIHNIKSEDNIKPRQRMINVFGSVSEFRLNFTDFLPIDTCTICLSAFENKS